MLISCKKNVDLVSHGSPCQDFSIAGNQKGGNEGSGTRSSLEESETKGTNSRQWVYDTNGIISTLSATDYKQPKQILETPCIAASRGRYNNDGTTSQRLEINDTGNTNTITSVQKDNYVLIDDIQSFGSPVKIYKEYSPTLRAQRHGLKISDGFRIRKLTPKECWRLMGFRDDQFEKASKVCSNSQLYKQAGNSIVVPVLERIFENLRYIFEQ